MAKKTFELEVLTPVHIGKGVTLNRDIDFVTYGDKAYILDERKIFEKLGPECIPQWVKIIEQGKPISELFKARSMQPKWEELASRVIKNRATHSQASEMKLAMWSEMEGYFIPGSSIKGAIRTMLFDYLIDKKNIKINSTDKVGKIVKHHSMPKEIFKSNDELVNDVFGSDANHNTMRFLQVSDAIFGHNTSELHELNILNIYGKRFDVKKGQTYQCESLGIEKKTILSIKFNEQGFNEYNKYLNVNSFKLLKTDIQFLLEKLSNFTKVLLEFELDGLNDYAGTHAQLVILIDSYKKLLNQIKTRKPNEAIFRVGGNSGYRFTSGSWAWADYCDLDNKTWFALREAVQKRDYSNIDLWPKTRKVTHEGIPMGFVKISMID